jgi:hypothetical protein
MRTGGGGARISGVGYCCHPGNSPRRLPGLPGYRRGWARSHRDCRRNHGPGPAAGLLFKSVETPGPAPRLRPHPSGVAAASGVSSARWCHSRSKLALPLSFGDSACQACGW